MDIKGYLNAPIPRWLALTAVVVTGVAAAGTTYFRMDRRFDRLFQEKVEEEVKKTTKFLNALHKTEYPTVDEAAESLLEGPAPVVVSVLVEEGYVPQEGSQGLTEVVRNVWTNAGDFHIEEEKEKRNDQDPYILDHDEFFDSEYPSVTLCWYEEDETLADEQDELVPDPDRLVGTGNLQRFGAGSHDPNVVYVHNPVYEVNYEIVKQTGTYAEQHYGFTDGTIKHEDSRRSVRTRKFQMNDE